MRSGCHCTQDMNGLLPGTLSMASTIPAGDNAAMRRWGGTVRGSAA